MHQPAPGKPYIEPSVTANGQRLNVVNRFTYLGSTLSQNVIDDEVNTRIAKASVAFGRLHTKVWNRRGISQQTKLKVYRATVLPMLLYACETWIVYQRHTRKLNHFHTTSLRRLLNIKWQDKIPDTEVLAQAGLSSIRTIMMQSQLRWAGHVARMPDHRLAKRLFYGELQEGKRSQGGQNKHFKDNLKISVKVFAINPNTYEHAAQAVLSGAPPCTKAQQPVRQTELLQQKNGGKPRASDPPTTHAAAIPCPHCQIIFQTQIGLFSHQHIHRSTQPTQRPDD